jgi:hypothetical protein
VIRADRTGILIVAALALALLLPRAGEGSTAPAGPPSAEPHYQGAATLATISLNPQSDNLFLGGAAVALTQDIAGVAEPGLGSFAFAVRYSSALVDVTVQEGPFLASTGRFTSCFQSSDPDVLHFNCSSSGAAQGPTGSGVLATLTVQPKGGLSFRAAEVNGGLAVFEQIVEEASLEDVNGDPISPSQIVGSVLTVRQLQGDVNGDCQTDTADAQEVSYHFQGTYNPRYDLQPAFGDGDVDALDVQFVEARQGSTCGAPIPAQPPLPGQAPTWSADNDSDGCSDAEEQGSLASLGGQRDPLNPWDFFDVPRPVGAPGTGTRDKQVDGNDALAVLSKFGASPGDPIPEAPKYDAAYDRGAPSPNPWDTQAPDGVQDGNDVIWNLWQFGHSCFAPP